MSPATAAGWSRDEDDCYRSPCGRFAVQRAGSHRWDLYRLAAPPRLASGRVVGEFRTLGDAQAGAV